MTDTTETGTVAADTAPADASVTEQAGSGLYAALAQLQSRLPRVTKGETAKVVSDRGNYKYQYADLADVSQAVMPLLGACGLSFISTPTITEVGFVLAYKLTHLSGESIEGLYPLPDPRTTPAQKVGSAITYARRYSLCAVTGIAPDGEDDDASAAQQGWNQSPGAAFDQAAPQGRVQRTASQRPASPPKAEDKADADAQKLADEAAQARDLEALELVHNKAKVKKKLSASVCNPGGGNGKLGKLSVYLNWRREQIIKTDKALADLTDAANQAGITADTVEEHVKAVTGKSLDDASPAEISAAAQSIRDRVKDTAA